VQHHVVNPSKQDQRAGIQFLGVEGCQPAEIRRWMSAVCGAACVSKAVVVDWLHMFQTGVQ
jgi:hypothetical protein